MRLSTESWRKWGCRRAAGRLGTGRRACAKDRGWNRPGPPLEPGGHQPGAERHGRGSPRICLFILSAEGSLWSDHPWGGRMAGRSLIGGISPTPAITVTLLKSQGREGERSQKGRRESKKERKGGREELREKNLPPHPTPTPPSPPPASSG